MQYRQLGNSGAKVSVVGLGTNRFGTPAVTQDAVNDMLAACVDQGINFLDTADSYSQGGSEERLGTALKGRWDRFIVGTKYSMSMGEGPNDRGASRYHMLYAVEASLRRLQTDHIDLYYLHAWDATAPVEEVLRGLDDLIRAGKVRYIGASQFMAWQLAYANLLAEMRGWSSFVVIQAHFHMLQRAPERELIPYCQAHHAGIVPYFPLAGGFLTGKYQRGEPAPHGSRGESSSYVQGYMTEKNYDKIEKLTEWARARGHAMNELALAWLLAQPAVCSVISGATRLEQVLANARAGEWSLTPDQVQEVNAILEPEKD